MSFKEKKQCYVDKFKVALALMPEDEKKYELTRTKIALRLCEAQNEHEKNVKMYEIETSEAKKKKLLADLTASCLELGIAKHQARYHGLKVD